ncbi:MAG: methyltransferase [Gemmataceae bacterium]
MQPQQQIIDMINANWLSQAVYVAAKLRIADHLQAGPRSVDELARLSQAHAPALYRLLRMLASKGVFFEESGQSFRTTPLADCLRSDVPGSQYGLALMNGEEQYRAWGELLHSVKTGQTGFEKVFGKPIFDYLAENPEAAATFDQAMVGVHGAETVAMLEAYDFSHVRTFCDIGGGNGSVLCALLQHHPGLKGMLYDLPNVIERAKGNLQRAGIAERCQCVAGSFFESVPAGADAYFLRHILHDWYDDRCLTILKNIHAVLPAAGKVLVCEYVIPPGNDPSPGKLLDLTMLVVPGGKERTEAEYRELFASAGLRLERVVNTPVGVSILEAVRG